MLRTTVFIILKFTFGIELRAFAPPTSNELEMLLTLGVGSIFAGEAAIFADVASGVEAAHAEAVGVSEESCSSLLKR